MQADEHRRCQAEFECRNIPPSRQVGRLMNGTQEIPANLLVQ